MERKKEKTLLKLRRSRKAFLLEYLCGFFLLGLVALLHYKGVGLNTKAAYFVLGLGLFSIGSAEIPRLMRCYKFGESKITIIDGLIKQHKKHVNLYAIGFLPDINIKQNRLQRLLNYGTIYVESGGTKAFKIEDVNKPHKMMEKIEELIEKTRRAIHTT